MLACVMPEMDTLLQSISVKLSYNVVQKPTYT